MELAVICALFFLAATLYTTVGHAGASAYLAIMALFAMQPLIMEPTALVLNILVASIASLRFVRANLVDWRLLVPFVVGAVPLAFLGGMIQLPGEYYRPFVGSLLLISAIRLATSSVSPSEAQFSHPPTGTAILSGGAIGLVSGLTGTGGGIFLSLCLYS